MALDLVLTVCMKYEKVRGMYWPVLCMLDIEASLRCSMHGTERKGSAENLVGHLSCSDQVSLYEAL